MKCKLFLLIHDISKKWRPYKCLLRAGSITMARLLYGSSIIVLLAVLNILAFEGRFISKENVTLQHQFDTFNNSKRIENVTNLIQRSSSKRQNESKSFSKKEQRRTTQITKTKSVKDFSFDEDCFFNSYPNFRSSDEEDFSILNSKEGRNFKLILGYLHAYRPDFYWDYGHKVFESACCKEKRCFFTSRTDKIPMEEFDAVIIHFKGLNRHKYLPFRYSLPSKRKSHQRWVFYDREPPWISGDRIEKYKGLFNWTMTYRRDADVTSGYGTIYPKSLFPSREFSKFERKSPLLEELLKTKKKHAAIFVSHCDVQSRRDEYVKMLQRYIPVDVYGGCGSLTCSTYKENECYEMLEKNYKFYLSFENSLCTDYVTEKFFNVMNYNIVPVVRGPEDYSPFAPPHSYIDARKYTVLELARYLRYLSGNDTAYLKYFEWKKSHFTYKNWVHHAGSLCDLCYKLHNDPKEKIYHNLEEWFYGKSKCYPKYF